MVNTFLTLWYPNKSPYDNFRASAATLDNPRLGKQRVEAYQILRILEDLDYIAEVLKWKRCPVPPKSNSSHTSSLAYITRVEWARSTRAMYMNWVKENKRKLTRTIYVGGIEEERTISLGFAQHAIVKMWVGHADALRVYITAHVDEWVSRGYKNTISTYDIDDEVRVPWWCSCKAVLYSHRAALLRKETERFEERWYHDNKLFTKMPKVWKDAGYLWTGSLNAAQVLQLMKGKLLPPSEICAPISTPPLTQTALRKKYSYSGHHLLDQDGYVVVVFDGR